MVDEGAAFSTRYSYNVQFSSGQPVRRETRINQGRQEANGGLSLHSEKRSASGGQQKG